ncbi:MAG: hypothetical protein M3N30_12355 [Bacteroidota bacterium]|nr:hypothetical protein [Bacteroidota bacterium]
MYKRLFRIFFILAPAIVFSQEKKAVHTDSSYVVMFNINSLFFGPMDMKINKFLSSYGYVQQASIPAGLRLDIAVMPIGHKMMYSIDGGTVVSRQDITTADLLLGVHRRFLQTDHFWLVGGLSVGGHFDRIVLNGRLPPILDSLSKKYNSTLSLHRSGLIAEPAVKIFWFPLKTKRYQMGINAGVNYDLDFNSHWRVGYYPKTGHLFKNLRKQTSVSTVHEYAWVLSAGISVCF